MNIPKFRYIKGTLYIDKETYNRDVMKVKEYKEDEIDRLNNIIKDIKSQIDYSETYSCQEDVFNDMVRRLDRIENIIKENNNAKD